MGLQKGKEQGAGKPCAAQPWLRQGCGGVTAPQPLTAPDSAFLLSCVGLAKQELSWMHFLALSPASQTCAEFFLLSFPVQFSLRVQRDHGPPPARHRTDLHSYKRMRPRRVIYFTLSATLVMTRAASTKYKKWQISDTTSFRKSLCS